MRTIAGIVIALLVAIAILGGMIAFGTAAAPPPLASIGSPFAKVDFRDLPPIEHLVGGDGREMAFRGYVAGGTGLQPKGVVIAIHGSSATSTSLHPLAKALSAEGLAVFVPDIRGHGDTGARGDIVHAGALDDDFADFVAMVRARHPGMRPVLIGFSSGGGFALHEAAAAAGAQLERTVLLSPMLGPRAPTVRSGNNLWVAPYVPRIIALLILDRLGVHAFEYLPVLAFAIAPENASILTARYSFRLMRAFGTRDYAADLRNAASPIAVLVGEKDELFDARLFAPTIHAVRPDVPVTVIPGLNHIEMTTDPRAIPAIVAALRGNNS